MSAQATAAGETRIGAAFALMIGATALFPVSDTISKLVTGVMPPLEVGFWRVAFQAGALAAIGRALRSCVVGPVLSPIVAAGGAAQAIVVLGLIGGLAVMPLATTISIFFSGPLIITVLSAAFLGAASLTGDDLLCRVGLLHRLGRHPQPDHPGDSADQRAREHADLGLGQQQLRGERERADEQAHGEADAA